MIGDLSPGLSATGKAWLDDDGQHIWLAHDCVGSRRTNMLPFPDWKAIDGRVDPSIICELCGFHAVLELSEAPA